MRYILESGGYRGEFKKQNKTLCYKEMPLVRLMSVVKWRITNTARIYRVLTMVPGTVLSKGTTLVNK